MTSFFLTCAFLGGFVLILQILLNLLGFGAAEAGDGLHVDHAGLGEGLELLSVRSVAAGVAGFGVGGLLGESIGMPGIIALLPALVFGGGMLFGTAFLMRQLLRLESDGTIRVSTAVGAPATVYVPIPAEQRGPGKVQLALQGRTVELAAVTTSREALPSGTPVVVVSVVDAETVEVIPASTIQEVLDANG